MVYVKLGNKLKKIRERAGISVTDLANRSELSRQTIYNDEKNDRMPRADVLHSWSQAMGIDMVALLEGAKVKAEIPPPEPEGPATLRDLKGLLERFEKLDDNDRELIYGVAKIRLAQRKNR